MKKSIITGLLWFVTAVLLPVSASMAENVPNRTFEIRSYSVAAGQLSKLHALFQDKSGRFFIKYGIQVIALWTPREEPAAGNTLVCILAHSSKEKALAAWKLFNENPKWNKFVAEYGVNGETLEQVNSRYYLPTDYSPLK